VSDPLAVLVRSQEFVTVNLPWIQGQCLTHPLAFAPAIRMVILYVISSSRSIDPTDDPLGIVRLSGYVDLADLDPKARTTTLSRFLSALAWSDLSHLVSKDRLIDTLAAFLVPALVG